MTRPIAVALAAGLLLLCGIAHGLRADRWQQSPALGEALSRVESVPPNVGDWQGTPMQSDPSSFEQAGAQAWWVRQYRHPRHQLPLTVVLMCGRAGRMAVHTPEVCYQGAGYDLYETPLAKPFRGPAGEDLGNLFTARFTKAAGRGSDLRLYWAWNSSGLWQAAANPRWEFRGQPFLYKLYVSHEMTARSASAEEDPVVEFMGVFGPELRKTLFAED
jgi:hypothetical protein